MFCKYCGVQLPEDAAFCTQCGEPTTEGRSPKEPSQLPDNGSPLEEKTLKKQKTPRTLLVLMCLGIVFAVLYALFSYPYMHVRTGGRSLDVAFPTTEKWYFLGLSSVAKLIEIAFAVAGSVVIVRLKKKGWIQESKIPAYGPLIPVGIYVFRLLAQLPDRLSAAENGATNFSAWVYSADISAIFGLAGIWTWLLIIAYLIRKSDPNRSMKPVLPILPAALSGLALLTLLFARPILAMFGCMPEVLEPARTYLAIFLPLVTLLRVGVLLMVAG